MNKLDISLAQVGCYVAMQVHSMDERFRAGDGDRNNFTASNGIEIASNSQPELKEDQVYLRGCHASYDYELQQIEFNSIKEAQEYFNKVLVALKEWAENWEGWSEKKEAANSTNRYQF